MIKKYLDWISAICSILVLAYLMTSTGIVVTGSKDFGFVLVRGTAGVLGVVSAVFWVVFCALAILRDKHKLPNRGIYKGNSKRRAVAGAVSIASLGVILLTNGYNLVRESSYKVATSFDYCTLSNMGSFKVYSTPKDAEKYKDSIKSAVSKLPNGLMDSFSAHGWDLVLYSSSSEEAIRSMSSLLGANNNVLQANRVKGLTVPAGRKVIILVENNSSQEEFERTLLHEVGHYFEGVTKPNNWEEIASKLPSMERWVGFNSSEIFAEIFSNICYDERSTYVDLEETAYLEVKKLISDFK